MYQILFDGVVARVGCETIEEAEAAKKVIVSEFEKKVTMRRLDPKAKPFEIEAAKREYELAKKEAIAFNKEFPKRLDICFYDEAHAKEPED